MTNPSTKVLIVDDDPSMTDLLDAVLSHAGFGVTVAHSGDEALTRAREDPPDAIVLDIVLPGMNGWDICRQFKAANPIANAPVFFVTGRNDPDDAEACAQVGGTALMVKPFDVAELLTRLTDSVRRVSAEQAKR